MIYISWPFLLSTKKQIERKTDEQTGKLASRQADGHIIDKQTGWQTHIYVLTGEIEGYSQFDSFQDFPNIIQRIIIYRCWAQKLYKNFWVYFKISGYLWNKHNYNTTGKKIYWY